MTLRFRDTQILADLLRQVVVDFGMAGDGRAPILIRIDPPGMAATFTEQLAVMATEVLEEMLAFQTAIFASW